MILRGPEKAIMSIRRAVPPDVLLKERIGLRSVKIARSVTLLFLVAKG